MSRKCDIWHLEILKSKIFHSFSRSCLQNSPTLVPCSCYSTMSLHCFTGRQWPCLNFIFPSLHFLTGPTSLSILEYSSVKWTNKSIHNIMFCTIHITNYVTSHYGLRASRHRPLKISNLTSASCSLSYVPWWWLSGWLYTTYDGNFSSAVMLYDSSTILRGNLFTNLLIKFI